MKFERITYAGHSAVFIEAKDFTIAIDPWLEGNPICPAALKNPKRLDLIILTHGHSDHASQAPALAQKYGSFVAATWELAMIMGNEGVSGDKIIPMNKGGCFKHKEVLISLVHAFHSSSYDTPNGAIYAGEPCGIVLKDGATSIYHAGDTALFSDMKLIAETHAPKIALLPIGDRFTMGPKDAARAVKMINPKIVVPIHYATFDLLTGTAEQFNEACRGLDCEVRALTPGESLNLS